jgi:hypothetical protein
MSRSVSQSCDSGVYYPSIIYSYVFFAFSRTRDINCSFRDLILNCQSAMQLPPPEVISQWPAPNSVDPTVRGSALLVVVLVLPPLAILIVGLRIFTRLTIIKFYGIDDTLIIVGAVSKIP